MADPKNQTKGKYWGCKICMNGEGTDWDGYCAKCYSKDFTYSKLNSKTSQHKFFKSMTLKSNVIN